MKIAITGILGYSGKYIARTLAARGHEIIGLTNSLNRENPDNIPLAPLTWDDIPALQKSLSGADVLVNTYWIRFKHGKFSHEQAVCNTKALFTAAKNAGVKRIVHVSITNPDLQSSLSYFKGKAELEAYLEELGVPYSILRPAVLFGGEPGEDILLNNMAWVLRRFPITGLFGKGNYKLQPIHVYDFAQLAAAEAESTTGENAIINAVGPETFTFRDLFTTIGESINKKRPLLPLPAWAGYAATRFMGCIHRDVMLTWPEIKGLMEGRLYVDAARPTGKISLIEWTKQHAATLGLHYSSELARRRIH